MKSKTIKLNEKQYNSLIYLLCDLNDSGVSVEANSTSSEEAEEGESIQKYVYDLSELIGVDIDKEAKARKITLLTYTKDDDEDD